jgi:hypothetical protein
MRRDYGHFSRATRARRAYRVLIPDCRPQKRVPALRADVKRPCRMFMNFPSASRRKDRNTPSTRQVCVGPPPRRRPPARAALVHIVEQVQAGVRRNRLGRPPSGRPRRPDAPGPRAPSRVLTSGRPAASASTVLIFRPEPQRTGLIAMSMPLPEVPVELRRRSRERTHAGGCRDRQQRSDDVRPPPVRPDAPRAAATPRSHKPLEPVAIGRSTGWPRSR